MSQEIITDENFSLPGGIGKGNYYVRGPVFGLYAVLEHEEELETRAAALALAGKLRECAEYLDAAAVRLD